MGAETGVKSVVFKCKPFGELGSPLENREEMRVLKGSVQSAVCAMAVLSLEGIGDCISSSGTWSSLALGARETSQVAKQRGRGAVVAEYYPKELLYL